jgi:hypothetical protein
MLKKGKNVILGLLENRAEVYTRHRLNMELDLQSLFGLHVHSCTRWLRPRNPSPHPSAFGLIYEGAIGQPRQKATLCDPLKLGLCSTGGRDTKDYKGLGNTPYDLLLLCKGVSCNRQKGGIR